MRVFNLLVGLVLVGLSVSAPAVATSCAMIENGRPESIVTGTETLWGDEGFFDVYDYAVTGVVVDVVTADGGSTEVTVDVINGFGVDEVSAEIVFTMPDPGWMSGYNFTPGRVYFIPMRTSPDQPPMICDPISEMTLAAAEGLVDLATVPVAAVGPAPIAVPTDTPTAAPSETPAASGTAMVWPVLGVVTVAGIVTAGLLIRRRRNTLA